METFPEIEQFVKNLYIYTILFCIAQWSAMLWIISRITGWAKLAKIYPETYPFRGKKILFGSLKMNGLGSYNNCVKYGADNMGIHLSLWPIFRIAHPPIFLPWGQAAFEKYQIRNASATKIIMAQKKDIKIVITERMHKNIENQSGQKINYA